MVKTRNYLLLITSFLLCGKAYSQTSNMALPQQVGVYSANSNNPSQMRLPPHVGAYQNNNVRSYATPYTVTPHLKTKTVVDYSKNPTINQRLYENVNGYQTPTKYVLQSPAVLTQIRAQEQLNDKKLSEEFGTEYYLLLSYGSGKFDGTGLTNDKVIPPMNNISTGLGKPKMFNLGFGVMQNRDIRIDVSYTNISGLKYDSTAYTEEQWCGPSEYGDDGDFLFDCADESDVTGGSIKSNALMLNIQFPVTEMFGDLFDTSFVTPYIGAGIGMSFNTVGDYTVTDEYGNAEIPATADGLAYDETTGDNLAGYYQYDGTITHFGAMTNNIAWSIEAGLTFNLDKKTMLDVYYKKANYGSIKSKDVVYYEYEAVDIVDPTDDATTVDTDEGQITDYCTAQAIKEGFAWNEDTDWCESESYTQNGYTTSATEKGKIETTEIGVKLRLIF